MTSRIDFLSARLQELHAAAGQQVLDGTWGEIGKKEEAHRRASLNISESFPDKAVFISSLKDSMFEGLDTDELINAAMILEDIYNSSENRYQKIIAALFLSRIHNYYLPNSGELINIGTIPYSAIHAVENQKFDEAIEALTTEAKNKKNLPEAMMKVLGIAYWRKAFSIIEEQVKVCFAARFPELFEIKALEDYRFKNPIYFKNRIEHILMPIRIEHTSCVGSDIFYLAMDRPQKSRCINISVDLFDSKSNSIKPPISVVIRPIEEKGIRLTSADLGVSKLVIELTDLFNMQNDDLSLLKAAVIVSGIVPPAFMNMEPKINLLQILSRFMSENDTFEGFEVISRVADIPRGSGLAVSTNLLAGLILALMRFSGQVSADNEISNEDKMQVVARCIYGEWLGGSGGGWQDCAGLWGCFKKITGQPSNPKYEPDSVGSLLPFYEELHIPEPVVERMLASIVLVNGGTGQDVGPVLRMITEQYILRDKEAWDARISTENRFDKIYDSLLKGDIRELGRLEGEDFEDRTRISMLSNNLYHQKVFARLKEIFKDDLWGYDSTGGRAGAGGIFIINPDCRESFENAFLSVSKQIQKELKNQMHFSSEPLIYKFALNNKGVQVNSLSLEKGEFLVNQWLEMRNEKNCQDEGSLSEQFLKIKEECSFDVSIFNNLRKKYIDGQMSIKNNIKAQKEDIKQIDLEQAGKNILKLPDIGSFEYERLYNEGVDLLKEPMAYIILNGGESTRFGVSTIRGLNPAFFVSGRYCSMIELKMRHVNFLRDSYKSHIYPVFVNSFFTDSSTMDVLKNNCYYGLPKEDVFNCIHQVSHRIIPKADDLIYAHEVLREKSVTAHEEELQSQYLQTMVAWAGDKGEGSVYMPEGLNKLYTFASPGHFYSFMSIISNYTLGFLLERGVKRLVVSSNDNLLATVDPAILAYHVRNGFGTTSEVVPRLYDSGGAPVIVDGRVEILEDFSFPDKETLWNTPFFNPITTWIEVDSLLNLLELTREDMISAAHGDEDKRSKCRQAVGRLAERINTYVVLKYISEDMGKGITYRYPVIQFEKLYGNLIGLLNPLFLVVPKALRHTQVKSVDHIYGVISDRAMEVLKPQIKF